MLLGPLFRIQEPWINLRYSKKGHTLLPSMSYPSPPSPMRWLWSHQDKQQYFMRRLWFEVYINERGQYTLPSKSTRQRLNRSFSLAPNLDILLVKRSQPTCWKFFKNRVNCM